MKHPLFKEPTAPLSDQEEDTITKELAAAYQQNELGEKRSELQRITQIVAEMLRGAAPDPVNTEHS